LNNGRIGVVFLVGDETFSTGSISAVGLEILFSDKIALFKLDLIPGKMFRGKGTAKCSLIDSFVFGLLLSFLMV
jgi:hypothetical protein